MLQIRREADDGPRSRRAHNRCAELSANAPFIHLEPVIAGACSGTGKQGQASLSAYSASKFGIRALTQCAGACHLSSGPIPFARSTFRIHSALEFGKHGITVNAYAPGPVKTPMCMCMLRHPFLDHLPLTFVLSGDDLETGLGTPSGALEEQVRTTPILSLAA